LSVRASIETWLHAGCGPFARHVHVIGKYHELQSVEEALAAAQRQSGKPVRRSGRHWPHIRWALLESELSKKIHQLANRRFGVSSALATSESSDAARIHCSTYYDEPPDRRIAADDVVYLDFGPLFEEWKLTLGEPSCLARIRASISSYAILQARPFAKAKSFISPNRT